MGLSSMGIAVWPVNNYFHVYEQGSENPIGNLYYLFIIKMLRLFVKEGVYINLKPLTAFILVY